MKLLPSRHHGALALAVMAAFAVNAASAATSAPRSAATAAAAASPADPALTPTPTPSPAPALPADSVYQLPLRLTDQQGREQALSERRGQPLLVSMFYTSCQFVCPMLVDTLKDTRARLKPEDRARLPVLLVSFDPVHDSVAVLQRTADQRGLDPAQWSLTRTDASSARKLAGVLGIQYRALPDGDFNHSTVILLLDAQGRIVARSTRLGVADPAFVQRVRAVMQGLPR